MQLRRELRLATGTFLVSNLILSFGAIGLFTRMGPAIERILQENVYSIRAAEDVLGELALAGEDPLPETSRLAIRNALVRARSNVTEPQEMPLLDRIGDHIERALDGDAVARVAVVANTRALIAVNHDAVSRRDDQASRLGRAGAWAAALIGMMTFALSLFVARRIERRMVGLLVQLSSVLTENRAGPSRRRVHPTEGPSEVREISDLVNQLLDERLERRPDQADDGASLYEDALRAMLLREPDGAALVDARGALLRASPIALDRLASAEGDGLRERLRLLPQIGAERGPVGEDVAAVHASGAAPLPAFKYVVPVGDGRAYLCGLPPTVGDHLAPVVEDRPTRSSDE
jgi:hypothetical protein